MNKRIAKYQNKRKTIYPLNNVIRDNEGNEYTLYHDTPFKYYVDILCTNPMIGIVFKGCFIPLGDYVQVRNKFERITKNFSLTTCAKLEKYLEENKKHYELKKRTKKNEMDQ